MWNRITAFFLSVVAWFYGLFGLPYYAVGEKIDMKKLMHG